jgi:uncharacterized protein YjbJ (UPF0337 family)
VAAWADSTPCVTRDLAGRRTVQARERGLKMGSKTDRVTGKVKQKTGEATGNESLTASGRREQVKGNVKASGKKLKDAAKKA